MQANELIQVAEHQANKAEERTRAAKAISHTERLRSSDEQI